MTKTTRRFTSKNVAIIGGNKSPGLAAVLASHQDRPGIAGPIAATLDVVGQMANDKAVQFHRDIAEHYKQRALKAEAQVAQYASTIDQLTTQVRELADLIVAKS